jgi:hypothetical protein
VRAALKAAAAYFALVFGAGFLLGAIRVPLLVPRLGARYAELLEMPLMLVVIVWSARHVTRRFMVPPLLGIRLAIGCIALSLLVAAELVLAFLLEGQGVETYIAGRDPISGGVYLVMLGAMALMPVFILRRSDA